MFRKVDAPERRLSDGTGYAVRCRGRYRHHSQPGSWVGSFVAAAGARVYRTDRCGAITVRAGPSAATATALACDDREM